MTNEGLPHKRSFMRFLGHYGKFVLFVAVIFGAGWAVGSGRVSLGLTSQLASQNETLPGDLNYESVEQLYDSLRDNYDGDLSEETILNGIKSGLAASTKDPYTEYLSATEAQEFSDDLNGSFSGIGAKLSIEEGEIIVMSPVPGYPAERAGLQARDSIIEIDEKPTTTMSLNEAVKNIRGEAGTNVKLKVIRSNEELDFDITRENITLPSVESEVVDGIGYMKITTFSDTTTRLARYGAAQFKEQGVKGVVLDVRGNPGGLLDSAVGVSSLWLSPGTSVLSERRGGEVIKTYKASGDPLLKGIPTRVLIDGGSASASEIVAGALKDNKVAQLVGVTSFGKGSVQNLTQLSSGGILKVTIARWYTPSGRNIDKEGIAPETKVEFTAQDFKDKRDPQKQAAIESL